MKTFYLLILFVSSLLFLLLGSLCFRLITNSPVSSSGDGDLPDDLPDEDPADLRSRWRDHKNISNFPYSDDGGPDPAPRGFSLSLKSLGFMTVLFFCLGLGLFNAFIWFMNH